jgi:hypothetical protein
MVSIVTASQLKWVSSINVQLPPGLSEAQAVVLIKHSLKEKLSGEFRKNKKRLVYIIRVTGAFAIRYPDRTSATIYIGEGDPANRLHVGHSKWLANLLSAINQFGLRIDVALPRRKRTVDFYKCVEADLIEDFFKIHGSLPLFNKQRETKHKGKYQYRKNVKSEMSKRLNLGKGTKIKWCLLPWRANKVVYDAYLRGIDQKSGFTLE